LKSSLRELKRQISQRRREPAWNFSKIAYRAVLADQVRQELVGELTAMRRRWREIQELLEKWQAAAAKLKPPRRRKYPPENMMFPSKINFHHLGAERSDGKASR
jgi:hypothetical protein